MIRGEKGTERNRVKSDVGWLCLVKASEIMFDIVRVNVSIGTMSIGLD